MKRENGNVINYLADDSFDAVLDGQWRLVPPKVSGTRIAHVCLDDAVRSSMLVSSSPQPGSRVSSPMTYPGCIMKAFNHSFSNDALRTK